MIGTQIRLKLVDGARGSLPLYADIVMCSDSRLHNLWNLRLQFAKEPGAVRLSVLNTHDAPLKSFRTQALMDYFERNLLFADHHHALAPAYAVSDDIDYSLALTGAGRAFEFEPWRLARGKHSFLLGWVGFERGKPLLFARTLD